MFGRPENGDLNGWQNHHLPTGIGGNGGLSVTQELVDAFFMKNGLPIEIREAIRRERRVELNCEGIRFNDIRRWRLGEQALNRDMFGMNFNGTLKSDDVSNTKAYFRRTFNTRRFFNKKMYLWPVPQAQTDINPNLVQMPGY